MALGVAIYFLYLYIWILPRGSSGGFPAARPVVPLLHSTKKQKMKPHTDRVDRASEVLDFGLTSKSLSSDLAT